MSRLTGSVIGVIERIAEWLGIEPSQAKRLERFEQKLQTARASNADRLEMLKDEIRKLEARALQKKAETDKERGDVRRMTVREIEQIFRDMDRLRTREEIISSNLDRISVALTKIGDIRAGADKGVREDDLDEIAIDVQEVYGDQKEADRAARDLDRERYEGPQRDGVDAEKRMGELGDSKEAAAEFSETTLKRLKELESDRA